MATYEQLNYLWQWSRYLLVKMLPPNMRYTRVRACVCMCMRVCVLVWTRTIKNFFVPSFVYWAKTDAYGLSFLVTSYKTFSLTKRSTV